MIVRPDEFEQIRSQAEAEYPSECCGVIFVRGDQRELMRCRNVQDELHAQDPAAHPRTSRTAYRVHSQDALTIARRESAGHDIAVFYHSHIEADAYFSAKDRSDALMGGPRPGYPAARHVVVSVKDGCVQAGAAFEWSDEKMEFVQVDLGLPGVPRSHSGLVIDTATAPSRESAR
jgi:proteasome lid subunit RPN8/RPN11